MAHSAHTEWKEYCTTALAKVAPLLADLGLTLDDEQPHLGGERYLMQSVTTKSGKKLILLGVEARTGRRVVIKVADDPAGAAELSHERLCRSVLADLPFAYDAFLTPEEVAFTKRDAFTIAVQVFIDQKQTFLSRPTPEQFAIALASFKKQEGAHAATYSHLKRIARTFGRMIAADYRSRFETFLQNSGVALPAESATISTLQQAYKDFCTDIDTVDQYCDFLTHTDFVPHNFRIADENLYMLDYSSIRFGNKYEGWARFTNFMALYNPELESALIQYVKNNRSPDESRSFKLMRLYRLAEIIWYYLATLERSEGDLHSLNAARVEWWTCVLESVLADRPVSDEARKTYISLRDRLRSPEEVARQRDLH